MNAWISRNAPVLLALAMLVYLTGFSIQQYVTIRTMEATADISERSLEMMENVPSFEELLQGLPPVPPPVQ